MKKERRDWLKKMSFEDVMKICKENLEWAADCYKATADLTVPDEASQIPLFIGEFESTLSRGDDLDTWEESATTSCWMLLDWHKVHYPTTK